MIVLGAGGHSKVVLDILIENNYGKEIIFYDNLIKSEKKLHNKYIVTNTLENLYAEQNEFIVAVGNVKLRQKLASIATKYNLRRVGILSNSLKRGFVNVNIDSTVDIMHNVIISSDVKIQKDTLINRNVSIHHDVIIGENCVISPGVQLLGGCQIGDNVFIGAGANIFPKVKIEDDSVIGAGSLVNKSISKSSIVFGNPAR